MAKLPILGLFNDANAAADAGDGLRSAGVSDNDFDFLTDAPYPEGAFGEREEKHKLYIYPFIGALLGLTSALLLTTMTQVAYPMVTGGKPIISLPPMAVISYEGTMLGAILFTVLGIIFESRLPNLKKGLYDTRITEGYIGVLVNAEQTQHDRVANVLNQAGAVDVKREN
jgi:molybdopterin-containing oxidoreductase family membrane subunit